MYQLVFQFQMVDWLEDYIEFHELREESEFVRSWLEVVYGLSQSHELRKNLVMFG